MEALKGPETHIDIFGTDPLTSTRDFIKDQTLLIAYNIQTIALSIEPAKNYADFARIKKDINTYLMQMFDNFLSQKEAGFNLAFEQSNISKYITENEREKIPLMELLCEKNKFYNEILSQMIALGKLDGILTQEEKEDFLNIVESGVFSFLDEIYLNRYKEIFKEENQGVTSSKPAYGGVKGGKIVSLRDLSEREIVIDEDTLAKIHHEPIRNYLLAFSKLIKEGTTEYQEWVNAEIHEVKSWQDRENLFGLVAPMEDYMYPRVLIEPELILFFRNREKKVHLEKFYELSEKYFQSNFGMNRMSLDFVETVLQTGDAAFSCFIGKAFPNDNELSEKEGNCIILKDTNMRNTVANAKASMMALLGPNFLFDEERLYHELIKEVTYHEFGHSLFIKGHGGSLMEEAKASLFYYLQVFEENKTVPYEPDEIRNVLEFTVMDSMRNIERINETSSRKYVILTKIILSSLFDLELLSWNSDGKLTINPNPENFQLFLENMKDDLFWIQEIYTHTDAHRESEETCYLDILEEMVKRDIEKMSTIIKNTNR